MLQWALAWLALHGAIAPAEASAPAIDVQWRGPPACDDESAVEDQLRTALQGIAAPRVVLRGDVRIAAATNELELALEVRAGDRVEQRSLSSPTCAALVDAAVLVAAVTAEAAASDIRARPRPPVRVPTVVAVPPATPPPRARALALSTRVAGGVGIGVLPRVDPILSLALALEIDSARIELALAHAFAQTADRSGPSGRFAGWLGQVRGCPAPRLGPVVVPLCVGVELGGVVASGVRVDTSRRASDLWVALVAAPAIVWRPAPRIGLWASGEAFAMLRRPGFALHDGTPIHRTAPAGARVLLGLEVRVMVRTMRARAKRARTAQMRSPPATME